MRVHYHEGTTRMADVSVLRPTDGELIQLGPTRLRILEDGRTTEHRLGIGEITPRRMPMARPSTAMPRTTRASSFRAARVSPSDRHPARRQPVRS